MSFLLPSIGHANTQPRENRLLPWLRRPSKGVEEPEGEEGGKADGHGVGVRVGADVREEVLELLHLHLVAGQLWICE